jgi:glutathione S-transferase
MILYHADASPFARKVRVQLHEIGRLGEVEMRKASGNAVDPGTMPLAHNPLGKLPCLIDDDGRALYDSRVICRFLEDRFGGGLYPAGEALWDDLVLEATADGIMDAAVLIVYEARARPEPLRFAPWVEGQWAKAARALDRLDSTWAERPAGPVTMGRIALGCALGYLDFRLPARDWRSSRPRLAAWERDFGARPAMMATRPAG